MATTVRGLSLSRPWPLAFDSNVPVPKRIENRKWKPYPGVEWLLLHASNSWDANGSEYIQKVTGLEMPAPSKQSEGYIFAMCRIDGCFHVSEDPSSYVPKEQLSSWAFGPYCWILKDFIYLKHIPCTGGMKLWRVPEHVLENVKQQLTALKS